MSNADKLLRFLSVLKHAQKAEEAMKERRRHSAYRKAEEVAHLEAMGEIKLKLEAAIRDVLA